jgi:ParB/RepB/Spo0J family partition protein
LTVYGGPKRFVILDGERRWRCSLRLGLTKVPVIVQPKPTRLQNIMMMFAIHNTRRDWDPLPTAYKLAELEKVFTEFNSRSPTESELAEIASISRGEVRRLKNLLRLPEVYHQELMQELEKPRSKQLLTVDHVLEATKGAQALRKRGVVDETREEQLRRAVVDKFRAGVIDNTVAPRKLARIARAVEREEVSPVVAADVVGRLIEDDAYTIDAAFRDSVEKVDFEHGIEQLASRLNEKLIEHRREGYEIGEGLRQSLHELQRVIDKLLGN